MRLRLHLLMVMAGGICAWQPALGQPDYGMLSNTCAGCHGTRGRSADPMPMIAGQSQHYLGHTMRLFKSGERPSTIMGRIARGYSDDELNAMAAFFASEPWMSPDQEVDAELVKLGQAIHQQQCEVCHRDAGRFSDEKTPRLAGQWRRYLELVMEEYWRPERKMPNLFMSIIIRRLHTNDLKALAHFYAAQK